jgi:hypothetical protein
MKSSVMESCFLRFVLLFVLSIQLLLLPSARADFVTTEVLLENEFQESRRAMVIAFVMRDDVIRQMKMMGIDEAEARERVASLTDEEVHHLASHIEEMPYGAGHGVGSLVGALLFIFVVLLVTDILGLTKVFPFTRPIR